jgi:hypothetical protein
MYKKERRDNIKERLKRIAEAWQLAQKIKG